MEDLKVDITITYNGKKAGSGVDFSDFLNEGRELRVEDANKILTKMVKMTITRLQRAKLVHPYEIIKEYVSPLLY